MSLSPTIQVVPRGLQFRSTVTRSCYINKAEITSGGMARILKAFKYDGEDQIGRDFALKIARENKPEFVDPIEHETTMLDRIGGRGAVKLVDRVIADPDSSEFGSLPGFVMPLLSGSDAAAVFEKHVGSVNLALNVLRLALDCYEKIHEAGVVHLDPKPENLFVAPDYSSVTVLDFGISRVVGTPIDVVIGTPAFMAPEIVQSSTFATSAKPTADLYSLAVTAFVAITNTFPYGDITDLPLDQVWPKLLFAPHSPLSSLVGFKLPSGLDDIFFTALERKPEDRFQSARAFRCALESVLKIDPTLGFTFALDY